MVHHKNIRLTPWLARAASSFAHTPNITRVPILPMHSISPVTEFLHKVVALVTALLITVGIYAAVDQRHARFVMDTVRENIGAVVGASRATIGGIATGAQIAETQVAAAVQDPAQAFDSIRFGISEGIPSVSPQSIQAAWNATVEGAGYVSVSIIPFTPPAEYK